MSSYSLRDCDPNYREVFVQLTNRDEHKTLVDKLIKRLETNESSGLTSEQSEAKLKEYGRNSLQKRSRLWVVALVLEATALYQIYWAIIITMMFCYILRPETPQPLHCVIYLTVTIVAITIYTYFKYGKETVIHSLAPQRTDCIRNGKLQVLDVSSLVPGDIIQSSWGNKIPADARIIRSDQSIITYEKIFENDLQFSATDAVASSESYWESKNMALAGGTIREGKITAVVVATGESTVVGKLFKSASAAGPSFDKPVLRKINKMINVWFLAEVGLGFVYLIANKTPAKIIRG